MALTIALILAFGSAACAVNYVRSRREGVRKYIHLQQSRKRAIETARTIWDKAENRQTAWRLSTYLCAIGVVFAVFIPGLSNIYQLIPITVTLAAMVTLVITAFKSQLDEQTFED